jgi:hypothetical protein
MPDLHYNIDSEQTNPTYRILHVAQRNPRVDIRRENALLELDLRVRLAWSSSHLPSPKCSNSMIVPPHQAVISHRIRDCTSGLPVRRRSHTGVQRTRLINTLWHTST